MYTLNLPFFSSVSLYLCLSLSVSLSLSFALLPYISLSLILPFFQEISALLTKNARTLQWAEMQCKLLLCVIRTGSFQLGKGVLSGRGLSS